MAATLNSLQFPVAEYGADEISALVLDPGYSITRAGFAGEDTPKSIIPSFYGAYDPASEGQSDHYLYNDHAVSTPQPNLDIRNPMSKEGIVEDWDMAVKLWEYAITSRLTAPRPRKVSAENGDTDVEMEDVENAEKPLSDSPLLITEPGWNPQKSREKTCEIAMEDWGCPAFFLSRSGVLSAFASGKPSALCIDIGASNTSVTPVWDGLMLKKGLTKSPLAGNWVSDQVRIIFTQSQPQVPITPHYMVASKTGVDAGAPAHASYKTFATPPKDTFRRYHEERVLTEFKESTVQVWNPGRNNQQSLAQSADYIKQETGKPFEMPDGWNQVFSLDRFRAVEGLFDARSAITDSNTPVPPAVQTIPAMVKNALDHIDGDIRGNMLANVVVTGGSSLITGLTDRIQYELVNMYPGARIRIQAPGNVVERKFAGWIGGSILASLGTFHQMWISKKEYEEHGSGIIERRCK